MTLSVTCNLGTDDLVVGKVSAGDTTSLTGKLFCLTALGVLSQLHRTHSESR